MATSAITALATITLGTAQATVTFSSITGSYRDLRLVATVKSATSQSLWLRFNSDAGANYSLVNAGGSGTAATSVNTTDVAVYSGNVSYPAAADGFMATIDIMGYSATDKHKSLLSRAGNSANGVDMLAGRWANTAAITSVTCTTLSTNTYAAGSVFTLYGVSA